MSVSMKPGATTFTVMPREPISRASDFEKAMMPALAAAGVTQALECGPGKALVGLIKRIDKSVDARPLGSPADLDAALAAVQA